MAELQEKNWVPPSTPDELDQKTSTISPAVTLNTKSLPAVEFADYTFVFKLRIALGSAMTSTASP
jgi:hypothetical protein